MSDLQAAATETTANLTALLGETEQAQTSLQESQAQVARVREQIEAAWTKLSVLAQLLLDKMVSGMLPIRTAAKIPDYNSENLSAAQEAEIITKLRDPASSIDLTARYLDKLQNNIPQDLSDDELFVAIATQYNRGDLTLEKVRDNLGYGESILKLRNNTRALLEE